MQTPPAPFIRPRAVLFKKGALVRNLTDKCADITPGKTYKVTQTSKGVVHFDDDVNFPRCRMGARYEVVRASSRDYVADHARRTLRKAGLTPEQAANVVRAIKASPRRDGIKLNELSRKIPKSFDGKLYKLIGYGFGWDVAELGLGLRTGYFRDLYNQHREGL